MNDNKDSVVDQSRKKQLEKWMEEYGDAVLRTAYFFMKDVALAEDIFQEVFLKVYQRMDTYRGEASCKTWILQITVNLCKDHLKSGWFRRMFLNLKPHHFNYNSEAIRKEHTSPETLALQNEEKRELLQKVSRLSLPLREVLILHYYHELHANEIASILKISESAVRSRLFKARQALKKQLENKR